MIKRLSCLLIIILLSGCTPNQDTQVELTNTDDDKLEMNEKYQALNDVIDQMKTVISNYDTELARKDKAIDDLTKRVVELETYVEQSDIEKYAMQYQNNYMAYQLDFLNDLIKEFDDYSTVSGIIKNYDEINGIIELDVLEYIPYYNEERIEELDIDIENEPIIAGAYIYNSPDDDRIYSISENCKIFFHQENDLGELIYKSVEELKGRLSETRGITFTFYLINGTVVRIVETFHN